MVCTKKPPHISLLVLIVFQRSLWLSQQCYLHFVPRVLHFSAIHLTSVSFCFTYIIPYTPSVYVVSFWSRDDRWKGSFATLVCFLQWISFGKSEAIAKERLKASQLRVDCTTVRILSVYFRIPSPRTRTERSTRLRSSPCFSTLELRLDLKLGS